MGFLLRFLFFVALVYYLSPLRDEHDVSQAKANVKEAGKTLSEIAQNPMKALDHLDPEFRDKLLKEAAQAALKGVQSRDTLTSPDRVDLSKANHD